MLRPAISIFATLCAPLIWADAARAFDLRSALTTPERPILEIEARRWRLPDGRPAHGAALTLSDLDRPDDASLLRGDLYVGGGGLSEADLPAYIGADLSMPITLGPTMLRPFLGASLHAAPIGDERLQGRAAVGLSADMGVAGALTLRADSRMDDAREADLAVTLGYGLAF